MENKEIDILESKSQLTWCDFSAEGFPAPKMVWRRLNHNGHRFYFAKDEQGICLAAGITTVIDKSFGESPFLREWKDSRPNWKDDLKKMARYGTLLHIALEQLLKTGKVDSELIKIAEKEFNKKTQFKKDCLSIIQFIKDHKVQPLFIEGILAKKYVSRSGKVSYISSAIDLFCKMTIVTKTKTLVDDGDFVRGDKKGQAKPQKEVTEVSEKEIYAIVDLKSNYEHKEAKSFFDSHLYQLIFGRELIMDNFDVKDVQMFNLSTLGWSKAPKYTLYEQKDNTNYYGYSDSDILHNRINTGLIEGALQPNGQLFEISDSIAMDESNYRTVSYSEKAEEILETLEKN